MPLAQPPELQITPSYGLLVTLGGGVSIGFDGTSVRWGFRYKVLQTGVGEGSEMSFISENISRSGVFWILILL